MDDRSFERFGGYCALGVALCSVGFALAAVLGGASGLGAWRSAAARASLDATASALLGAQGLLITAAAIGIAWRVRHASRLWALWGGALGLVGGFLMSVHGLWDMQRGPALLARWMSGDEVGRVVLSILSLEPTAVDPGGMSSLVLVGLFVLVTSRLALSELTAPQESRGPYARLGLLGTAYGVLLLIVFVLGLLGLGGARAVLGGLAMLVVAPLWWVLVGRALLDDVPRRDVPRMSLS